MSQKIWKVYVLCYGETKYATNAMEYKTKEESDAAAANLASRWLLVDKWESREEEARLRDGRGNLL